MKLAAVPSSSPHRVSEHTPRTHPQASCVYRANGAGAKVIVMMDALLSTGKSLTVSKICFLFLTANVGAASPERLGISKSRDAARIEREV
jgi:hypothetical protein